MPKIICPYHDDTNPSLELYENGGYCFVCGIYVPRSKLPIEHQTEYTGPRYIEDLEAKRKYIDGLPTTTIRGFPLKCDNNGYYLLWDDCLYYKFRPFNPGNGPRYLGPSGHSEPPMWVRRMQTPELLLVEGEINAISLSYAFDDCDIVSVGSATKMRSKEVKNWLTTLSNYRTVVLVVDDDAEGSRVVTELEPHIKQLGFYLFQVSMSPDSNEILVNHGPEALRKEVCSRLQRKNP